MDSTEGSKNTSFSSNQSHSVSDESSSQNARMLGYTYEHNVNDDILDDEEIDYRNVMRTFRMQGSSKKEVSFKQCPSSKCEPRNQDDAHEHLPLQHSAKPFIQGNFPELEVRNSTPCFPSVRASKSCQTEQEIAKSEDNQKMPSSFKFSSTEEMIPKANGCRSPLFNNMRFYYIPNDDIAPMHKIRIAKAQDNGATRVQSASEATHIIVDKNLTLTDIIPFLEGGYAKTSDRQVIVNENFPLDCIRYQMMLDWNQSSYLVTGSRVSETNESLLDKTSDFRKSSPNPAQKTNLKRSEGNHIMEEYEQNQSPLNSVATHPKFSFADELSKCIETMQQYGDIPIDEVDKESEDEDLLSYDCRERDEERNDDEKGIIDELDERYNYINGPSVVAKFADKEKTQATNNEQTTSLKRNYYSLHNEERPLPARKQINFADRFACNHGGKKDAKDRNTGPNGYIIDVLSKMCSFYDQNKDQWRAIAYRKAIQVLRRQDTPITTASQARNLPMIGERLALKIEEIAQTNKLRRLEFAQNEPIADIFQTFVKIYDVGYSQANKWITQGYRSLEDLQGNAKLTRNQRIGIERYHDLNTRIPREEVTAIVKLIKATASVLNPAIKVIVGGSYRRGASDCHDIDIIITKSGTSCTEELAPFLYSLISQLIKDGIVVATLVGIDPTKSLPLNKYPTSPSPPPAFNDKNRDDKSISSKKWFGCCVLPDQVPPIWRRVDFLLVPDIEYGASLLYFTGNDIFNRSMRLLARKKGMRLNQHGLFADVMRGPRYTKDTTGRLVEGQDEKKIFEILGVQWREPEDRWC